MNYLNSINAIKSYFTQLSKRVAGNIQDYSTACKVGVAVLTALVAVEFAKPANAEELYIVKRSDKPVLERRLDAESAEDFYDKGASVITAPKTQKKKLQRLIADLSLGLEAGEDYGQIDTGAKLIITPDFGKNDAWRIIAEGTSRAGVKKYPLGDDLVFGEIAAAAELGLYADLRKMLKKTKAYFAAGVRAEGTEYTERTEMTNCRILAMLAAGFFSEETGTNAKITLAAGQGEYSLETAGTEQTGRLTRMLADLQIKQEVPGFRALYGKARLNATLTDYANRTKSTAVSGEIGPGLQGIAGILGLKEKCSGMDAFIEALFTARQENDLYFNGAEKARTIIGAKLLAGANLGSGVTARAGVVYDEELLGRLILELLVRL